MERRGENWRENSDWNRNGLICGEWLDIFAEYNGYALTGAANNREETL